MKKLILACVMYATGIICVSAQAQQKVDAKAVQTIRGQVTDIASGETMPGVSIVVEGLANKGAVSDMDGNFVIERVPVGRHTIAASFIGYEPLILKEQMVTSGKELVINMTLKECVTQLSEIVARPQINKQQPLNEMALSGARMFSVEEASRYAGGMSDPARTASMFAGVAAGGATNGISIHGNSPSMLQWRIEGIEVYNPNHFADITQAGGGVFTSLSALVLGNSDFMTGAMPAEYGNALSGVFDVKMRSGNNTRYEHAFQIGTLGIDFASEGPIGHQGTKASYLINYRYSTLGLAQKIHAISMETQELDYQDLSFKLNFPAEKVGTFAVWFTGLIDRFDNDVKDREKWETMWDMNSSHSRQRAGAGGLTHTIKIGNGGRLKTSMAVTANRQKLSANDYDDDMKETPSLAQLNVNWNYIFNMIHQHKISSRYTIQNGINHQHYDYDFEFDLSQDKYSPLQRLYETDGSTGLTRVFTNHKVTFNDRLSAVAGLNVMWYALNSHVIAEPRVSMAYKMTPSATIAVAYAQNSRKENTEVYFVKIDGKRVNEELGLTRSHHVSLTYSQRMGDNALLKIEPYFQKLFDVPVEKGTTFSIINNVGFYIDKALVNNGEGRNYGIDMTLERYLKDGLYGMVTATVFKSEYSDAQGVWHHTRHDRGYIANILGGKEWMVGKEKKNIFGLNGRLTMQGGERYTPIRAGVTYEEVKESGERDIPHDESKAFEKQLEMNTGYALSLKFTINKEKIAHHFIAEYMAMKSFEGQTYNINTKELVDQYTSLTFPNIAYRIEF